MRLLRVGAASLNQTPLDWAGNTRRIRQAITEARAANVDVLCLPELCTTGYGCEDAFHAGWVLRRAEQMVLEILADTQGMAVCIGLPVQYRNAVFNAAVLIVDGQIQGVVAKQFLASDGIHYESRWFEPWMPEVVSEVAIGGQLYPFGDLVFDVGDVRIGFEICEDAWVAHRPGARHALDGVDVVLNPSASHFAFDKNRVRERFIVDGSRAYSLTYVYANLVGNESGRAIFEGGSIIAHDGALVAHGPRLNFAEVTLTTAVVDVEASRLSSKRTRSFHPDSRDAPEHTVQLDFEWPRRSPDATGPGLTVPLRTASKEEDFARAEALALFDYLRKSRSKGFVVSMSGGADSAACAVLVHAAVQLAWEELGQAGFKARLGYLTTLADAATPKEVVTRLLTTLYQGTENSSAVTTEAARAVAEAIGAEHLQIDVGGVVQAYEGLIEGALNTKLTWEAHDIARQNIQARVRSPSVWMIANLRGALLLSTSNRSEAAVGYATMDGDTSGGLSPIAGIDKDFLRQWLRWMQTVGLDDLPPIAALSTVNVQQPTAELRPSEMGQTDEADLMPYPVLDAIEEQAIRLRRSPVEIFELLNARMPEVPVATLGEWIARFFRLWARNQWKRERYAPSFHLDDRNLDPRSWCRFPILSGGFAEELAALEEEVAKCR